MSLVLQGRAFAWFVRNHISEQSSSGSQLIPRGPRLCRSLEPGRGRARAIDSPDSGGRGPRAHSALHAARMRLSESSKPESKAPGSKILPGGIQVVARHDLRSQMGPFVARGDFELAHKMLRKWPEVTERVDAIDRGRQRPPSKPRLCCRASREPDVSRIELED